MASRRVAVSIVSVWNNEAVRLDCLDRSIEDQRAQTPDLEYLPVDNRGQRHATAGAALNEGVRDATRDVVVFVQQDIYLHSLVALEEAAAVLMDDPGLGLVGAVGIGADGRIRGRIRDRLVLIGETDDEPMPVDSLDEVLFLARRSDLLEDPLSEDPVLAWHAYAVEWGQRRRGEGRAVVAIDIPMSHNSLSTNLARLDEAHAAVARMHPDLLPLQTTCGVIGATGRTQALRASGFLADHRWRLRWAKASLAARTAHRAAGGGSTVVLGDLRRDIDRIAEHAGDGPIRVHNVVAGDRPFMESPEGTRLRRASYDVVFTSGPLESGPVVDDAGGACIWTNVDVDQLAKLRVHVGSAPHVVGYHDDIGYWVLVGDAARHADEIWTEPQSRPARLLV